MTPTNPTDKELIASQQEALLRETNRADLAVARAEAAGERVRVLEAERDEWLTPFDGDGIAWHENLPSPYTYKASDFSALVTAVHAYECRSLAAEERVRVLEAELQHWKGANLYPSSYREAVERVRVLEARQDWLVIQLRGCADDAKILADTVGLAIGRALERNLRDALRVLDADTPEQPYPTPYRCPKCGMPEVCDDSGCPGSLGDADTPEEDA